MFGIFEMTTGRRARIVLGAIAFAVATRAQAGEARKPPRDSDAKTSKAICRVKITGTDGLPLATMALIAFEDGVYRLRTEAGREIEIAEKTVSAAEFMPLTKPRHDKREFRDVADRRPPVDRTRVDGGRRPKGADKRDSFFGRRIKEERDRLYRLKRSGGLGREINGLKTQLRRVATAFEAASLVRRIFVAKSVQDGAHATGHDLKALLATIEKSEIRERMKGLAADVFLRQPGGPRKPRR